MSHSQHKHIIMNSPNNIQKKVDPFGEPASGRKANKHIGAVFDARFASAMYIEAVSAQIQTVPKSNVSLDLIRGSLAKHFIFRNLKSSYLSVIIHHMKLYNLSHSELIFEQGCPGSNFYIVAKGKLEVVVNNHRVKILSSGDSFGEMALLHDTPRTASVYTISACSLWTLDRDTFRKTVEALELANYEENKQFIESIPIFASLSQSQKETLVHSLTTQNFIPGSVIVHEGDPGDLLYIIKEGIVLVTKGKQEVRRMGKGFYFGEQALLNSSFRTATVTAVDNVKCVAISGSKLTKVLGSDLQRIIHTNSIRIAVEKNENLQKLMKAQIESLVSTMKIQSFNEGDTVITQGPHNTMWVVVRGSLVNAKNKICIGKVFDTVNADSLVYGNGVLENDIKATEETTVAVITKEEFEKVLGGNFQEITSNNDALNVLCRIQVLRGINRASMENIIKVLKTVEYADGEVVVEQNDPGEAFFIVKTGKAEVYKDGSNVRTVSKHDYFGERALLFNNFRSATVKAKGSLTCWVIFKSEFTGILEESIKKQLLSRIELQDDTVKLTDLAIVKPLGRGMFGDVFLTVHKEKQILYALKSVDRRKISAYQIHENILLERKILLELDHIFIMKLIRTFQDQYRLYFLLEFIDGMDLFDVLRVLGLLSESDSRFYTACLLTIFGHLHEREIIYRDLKPENIVVDEDGYPKLIDFGTAKFLKGRTFTIVGTPHYMAPEVITGHGYSLSADYWSLGVVTYEFLYGKVPFGEDESDPYTIYEKVQENEVEFPRWSDKKVKCKEFILQMLSKNPGKRLGGGLEHIKNHLWFHGFDWDKLLSKLTTPPFLPKVKDLSEVIVEKIAKGRDLQDVIARAEAKVNIPQNKKRSKDIPAGWDKEF